jgi:hypothetical protein
MSFFSNLLSGLGAAGGAVSQSFEEIQRQDLARAEARAREMATNRQLQQRANESYMDFEEQRLEREATQQQHLATMAADVRRDEATLDYRTTTARLTAEDRAGMRQLDIQQAADAREDARLARREDEDYIFFDGDKKVEISLANAAVRGADGDLGVAVTRFLSMTEGQGFTEQEAYKAVRIANERGQMVGFSGDLELAEPVVEEEEGKGMWQSIGDFFGGDPQTISSRQRAPLAGSEFGAPLSATYQTGLAEDIAAAKEAEAFGTDAGRTMFPGMLRPGRLGGEGEAAVTQEHIAARKEQLTALAAQRKADLEAQRQAGEIDMSELVQGERAIMSQMMEAIAELERWQWRPRR